MEALYAWVRNLAVYFIIISTIINALPDNRYVKYIRFFLGMLLILLILQPVLNFFDWTQELDSAYYTQMMEQEWQEQVEDMGQS